MLDATGASNNFPKQNITFKSALVQNDMRTFRLWKKTSGSNLLAKILYISF